MRVQIQQCATVATLYEHHVNMPTPEQVFLCLDSRIGKVWCESDQRVDEMTPEVWNRHVLRWPIPLYSGHGANQLMHDVRPIMKTIIDGFGVDGLDGSGLYTNQAEDAIEAIMLHLDENNYQLLEWFSAADWCAKFDVHVTGDEGTGSLDTIIRHLYSFLTDPQHVDRHELTSHIYLLWSNAPDESLIL